MPDLHTLDITELNVLLVEARRRGEIKRLRFLPEPYCHVLIGQLELKPDGDVRIETSNGIFRYFIEVDLGTEWRPELTKKMRRYVSAYHHWPDETFPLVMFIVHDEARLKLVESVIKRQEVPGLFEVVLFDEAIAAMQKT